MRSLSPRKRGQIKGTLLLLFLATGFLSISILHSPVSSAVATAQSVNLTMSPSEFLKIDAPRYSSITLLSLSGGQYSTQLSSYPTKNELVFTPMNNSVYTMVLNISSAGSNYALVAEQTGLYNTIVKNLSAVGNLEIFLTVNAVGLAGSGNANWNPLFGFTGFSLGGITINTAEFVAAIVSISILFIGMGLLRLDQRFLYFGMILLSLSGIAVVGIFMVFLVWALYFAGFVCIRSLNGVRKWKRGS